VPKSKQIELSSVVNISASKTLALADAKTRQKYAGSTAITVTIPLNSAVAFPVDTVIQIAKLGSGAISYAAASGAFLNGGTVAFQHVGTGTMIELWQESINNWWILGSRV
jgi:hypothetical protein